MGVETPTPPAAPAPKTAEVTKVAPKDPKVLIAEADAVIKDSQSKIEEARKKIAAKPEAQGEIASNMELVKRRLSTLRQQVEASQHALREKQKTTQKEDEYHQASADINNLDIKRKEIAKTEYLAGNAHLKWQTAVNTLDKVGETVGTVVGGAATGVNTVYKTLIEPVVQALGAIGKPAWKFIKTIVGKVSPQAASFVEAVAPTEKTAEQLKPEGELQSVLTLLSSNRVAVTPPAGVAPQDLLTAIDSCMESYKENKTRGTTIVAGAAAPASYVTRVGYVGLVAKAIDKKNPAPGTIMPMAWDQFIAAANKFNDEVLTPAPAAAPTTTPTQNAAPATTTMTPTNTTTPAGAPGAAATTTPEKKNP